MKTVFPFFVVLLLAANLARVQAETLTYADLVQHLTDMEHLAVLPPVGEKTALASSYDRASQYDATNDKYINWSANADDHGVVREEGDTVVMADLKGPGCIWRIWSAAADEGHVRIYLDGSTTPAIDLPFKTYFDRDKGPFPWKNLCYLAASEAPAPNVPGSNLYVPIPFAKSCKITGDKQKGSDVHTIWGGYYHINYTTFPAGTVVPTFKLPFAAEDKAALDAANEKLNHCGDDPAGPRPGEKTETKTVTLASGGQQTVFNLTGPEAITGLRIKVPLNQPLDDEEKRNLLRQLTIGIKWDGEQNPSVWSPLGDFFATVGGAEPFATLPVGLQPDGTLYCVWYMPFGQSAQIELGNDGPRCGSADGHGDPCTAGSSSSRTSRGSTPSGTATPPSRCARIAGRTGIFLTSAGPRPLRRHDAACVCAGDDLVGRGRRKVFRRWREVPVQFWYGHGGLFRVCVGRPESLRPRVSCAAVEREQLRPCGRYALAHRGERPVPDGFRGRPGKVFSERCNEVERSEGVLCGRGLLVSRAGRDRSVCAAAGRPARRLLE